MSCEVKRQEFETADAKFVQSSIQYQAALAEETDALAAYEEAQAATSLAGEQLTATNAAADSAYDAWRQCVLTGGDGPTIQPLRR